MKHKRGQEIHTNRYVGIYLIKKVNEQNKQKAQKNIQAQAYSTFSQYL